MFPSDDDIKYNKFVQERDEYVKKYIACCINANKLIIQDDDWLKLKKTLGDYHHIFKYCDEYNHKRYYTLHTYSPNIKQVYAKGNYESLGFWSDKNGHPLCEDADPFNYGTINNTGSNIIELHYKSYLDLRDECRYFWDKSDSKESEN